MAFSFCGKRLLITKSNIFLPARRNGYIVLVPEIGEDLGEKNPLTREDGLPEFNNFTIEKCVAAIGTQTNEFEKEIHNIESNLSQKTTPVEDEFKTIFDPIENVGVPLDITWGLAKTMYLSNSTLMPTKSYMMIHDRARRARSTKFNSEQIYTSLKHSVEKRKKFTDEQNRIVNKFILEGKLNGLELKDISKIQFQETITKLNKERNQFKSKVYEATKKFKHTIGDLSVVRDFPIDLLKLLASDPSHPNKGPWTVTLQPHIYNFFMEYCPDRELRWNLWQANVRKASGYADKSLETSTTIEKIRSYRQDQAKLLGYETYSQMSMETKMAKDVNNINNVILQLLEHARPAQDQEIKLLEEFAAERGFEGSLEIYDIPYWKRKQQKSVLSFDEEQIREYFPFQNVLSGLFQLCKKLFNIEIRQRNDISTWHSDVKFFDIFEDGSNNPVAGFYLDPYLRSEQKIRLNEGSGSMVGIINRSSIVGTKPLAALIFNFQPPSQDKQSLLKFKDVKLLFYQFGQALQHLLAQSTYSEVSGLSNIEWDAVGICGHVMTHFLYDRKTMHNLSCHYMRNESLPTELMAGIEKIRTHMAGLELCQELYLATLDLELHSSKDFWLDIVKRIWPQFNSFSLEKKDSHLCSFTPIFSEEWGAAYYSRFWSHLVAADVYSAFHESKGDEQKMSDTGKRFRDTYLALGGSCHPSEIFRRFRGRDPSPKALLRTQGLKKIQSTEENIQAVSS